MIADNQMISRRQASWIFILNLLAAGLFSMTATKELLSPAACGISCLVAVFLTVGYDALFFKILTHYEKKTGHHLELACWPVLLKALLVVLSFVGLTGALHFFAQVTDDPVAVLFLMAVVIYAAGKGMEVRGRLAEWLGWLIVVPLFLLMVLGVWQVIKSGNGSLSGRPDIWMEKGMDSSVIMRNSFEKAAFLMIGDHPLIMWQTIHGKNGKKDICAAAFWLAGGLLMASVWLTVCMLRPECLLFDRYPFDVLLQIIHFPGHFMARYDIFFRILWMMSYFIFTSGMLLQMTEVAKQWLSGSGQCQKAEKKLALLLGLLVLAVVLCGCDARREPQNRHYLMCIGIDRDEKENGWSISYGFPDLAALTGTDAGEAEPVRVVHATTIAEGAGQLNASSDKTADYSQMPVILIEKALLLDDAKRIRLMKELAAEKTIRRTALVVCAEKTAAELLALDDDVNGSIGVFISELCQNNYAKVGYTLSVLEDFVGGRPDAQMVIPVLAVKDQAPQIVQLIFYNSIQN